MQVIELETNNVKTTFIKTNKFKTISIQVVFLGEFNQENATKRSLLSRILPLSTKKYPTKKKIYNKLYDLYDTSIGVSSYPTYKTSITRFAIDYINPLYLLGQENLHLEALKLLKELIFHPNIKKTGFEKKLFNEQKNILKQNILNIYNNKNRYALRQLLNEMGRDEILSVSALGNLEDLELINEQNLYSMYQEIIENEQVSIFVIGDFDDQEMIKNLKVLGNFKNPKQEIEVVAKENKVINEVREFSEVQNINQSKLILGFRTKVNSADSAYPAALVFNAMFGGTFQSDLIRVVREENSLAYTIVSQMIPDLKVLIVSAGIDSSQYKLTKDLIINELNNYKKGNLSLGNMQLAKDSLINNLIEIEDSPILTINFYLKNQLYKINETIADVINSIKEVSLQDIRDVASGVDLDTIFLLAGEKDES